MNSSDCLRGSLTAIVLLLLFRTSLPAASEYSIRIGGEDVRFVSQPQMGYVVKVRNTDQDRSQTAAVLKQFGVRRPHVIGGRKSIGYSIVLNSTGDSRSTGAMDLLKKRDHVSYAAPLFEYAGWTVAIIPEILVFLDHKSDLAELSRICQQSDFTITEIVKLGDKSYCLVTLDAHNCEEVFNATDQLNNVRGVKFAKPNITFQPQPCGLTSPSEPNDEYFSQQWHLNNTGQSGGSPDADISAQEAWGVTSGDPRIVVAILDTGVEVNHPDLIESVVEGYDFFDDDYDPRPSLESLENAHGTACAGLVAACKDNGIGVSGVAPECKIMPVRMFSYDANGVPHFANELDFAKAIKWAAEHGADILSNSWNCPGLDIIREAIIEVTEPGGIGRSGKGCVFLAGSGNVNASVRYPGRFPEAISVGATDHRDDRFSYSCYGARLDIMAPSGLMGGNGNVWTTDITGDEGRNNRDPNIVDYTDRFGGTSAACPIAAGVSALILSVDPNLNSGQVRRVLIGSAKDLGEPGWDKYYGYGRVDASAAVMMADNPPLPLYVDDNAPDDPAPGDPCVSDPLEDGSLEHPCDSLQECIDRSLPGDTILVMDGIYTGPGNREIDFLGKALLIRSLGGPERCVIDCQHLTRGFHFYGALGRNSLLEGLTIANGNSQSGGGIRCEFSAWPTIKNCVFKGNSAENGGGMHLSSCDPLLISCIFAENTALERGGGVYSDRGPETFYNCTFIGNSAEDSGGAVYTENHAHTLYRCTFIDNSSSNSGGAIYNYDDDVALRECDFVGNSANVGGAVQSTRGSVLAINCQFTWNTARSYGGALYIINGSRNLVLQDCTVAFNSAALAGHGGHGGGIYCFHDVVMKRCTIKLNSADFGGGIKHQDGRLDLSNSELVGNSAKSGGGIFYRGHCTGVVANCNFLGNRSAESATVEGDIDEVVFVSSILRNGGSELSGDGLSQVNVSYCNVQGGWAGNGNIDSDPCFIEAGYWDHNDTPMDANDDSWIDGDHHLLPTSPCIDTGDPNYTGDRFVLDLYAGPRLLGNQIDMGADEYASKESCNIDATGRVDFKDYAVLSACWQCLECSELNTWCEGRDFDRDGEVTILEMFMLFENWLWLP